MEVRRGGSGTERRPAGGAGKPWRGGIDTWHAIRRTRDMKVDRRWQSSPAAFSLGDAAVAAEQITFYGGPDPTPSQ